MSNRAEGEEYKKGLWTVEEDNILMDYVKHHGKGQWNRIAKKTGLNRCGKSCRLRWMNYLSPNVKKGNFTDQEEDLIIRLHKLLGNRWSLIAKRVPGRTDNQVKNYWNTHLSKKLGIKDQTTAGRSNGQKCSEDLGRDAEDRSNGQKRLEDSETRRDVPSGSGGIERLVAENSQNREIKSDELLLSGNVPAATMVEDNSDYMSSLLVGNEFALSSLTTFMDFMDGYSF